MQPNFFTAIVARAEASFTRLVFFKPASNETRHEAHDDEAAFDVNAVRLTSRRDASNEEALDASGQLEWRRRHLRLTQRQRARDGLRHQRSVLERTPTLHDQARDGFGHTPQCAYAFGRDQLLSAAQVALLSILYARLREVLGIRIRYEEVAAAANECVCQESRSVRGDVRRLTKSFYSVSS